jgi:hypothetical protein
VIQLRTQTAAYWGPEFILKETDMEFISSFLLEIERPQTAEQLTKALMAQRVTAEKSEIERMLSGRTIYRPQNGYEVDEDLVFPAMEFTHGQVKSIREGFNPQHGRFNVIAVQINGKTREFAADLPIEHPLNTDTGELLDEVIDVDIDRLYVDYGVKVQEKLLKAMNQHQEYVRLGHQWFMKVLMADINIGHLHLTEAILEMNEGGPLAVDEILPHLDLDASIPPAVQEFSLNYYMLQDERFDEVAPVGKVAWFLRRLEPENVQAPPQRLIYPPVSYDRALISPQLAMLERELDDEWSDIEAAITPQPVVFTLTYPHRLVGTIPLSSRIRPLFQASNSPRQRIVLLDEISNKPIQAWAVREYRYIYGLEAWYAEHEIPIGGFVHLKPGLDPGVVILSYDVRRPQREWMRLATVVDNRLHFELHRRTIGCGYDELMIVGTDVITAVDALWRRADSNSRSIASLLAEIFPPLAELTPQKTVHAKTLYSAINMLRRLPPGPLFAELIRQPAFQPVGDHYWRFDSSRWRDIR